MANIPDSAADASWTSPGAGITGGYNGNSQTLRIFIVFFSGLAMYNAVELIIMILLGFRRYCGLYFWSLMIASIGIIPYALGFLLKFMNITTGNLRWLAVVFLTIGWYPMVTGQSVVLWSRLHLVVQGPQGDRTLRWTKWMIIVNAIILHIPTTVLTFGSNGSIDTSTFETGYNVMEKIQMIGFFIQEVILSSIYIVETIRLLRTSLQPGTRKTMKQLIAINVVIILMDMGLLGLECASLYILETVLKGAIYSIKLKLEFAILGKLIKFVSARHSGETIRKNSVGFVISEGKASHDLDPDDFVDLTRVDTNITHPSRTCRSASRLTGDMDSAYEVARFEHIEDVRFEHSKDVRFEHIKDVPMIGPLRGERSSQSPLRNGDDAV